jgi:hypothetical protein
MNGSIPNKAVCLVASVLSIAMATPAPVLAQTAAADASNAQKQQDTMVAEIPHCTHQLGTLSIVNGDDPRG